MKNTTNVFQEGIITDQNPLTMPETALTSALNATIITGNGNEGLLQNDMGNTLIKDSITGNVMSLNDGFIPIGMKEHGGILYIASYNPATNEGELGSIPSPILNYTYSTQNGSSNNISISDISSNSNASVAERINSSLIYLSDHVFHGGDKFIINLQLGLDQTTYTRQVYDNNGNQVSESFPIVTKFDGNDIKKGWYSIKLYAVTDSGKEILLSDAINTPQRYYKSNDSTERTSDYWFLTDTSDLDINKTRSDNLFRTYPNIPAGRLGIKVVPEYHKELQFIYNTSYNDNLPQIYLKTEGNNQQKWVIVHGFTYESDCPIQPDKIEIDCQGLDLYECTDDGPSTKIGTTVVLEKDGDDYSYKVTTNLKNKYIVEKDWVNPTGRSVENYNNQDINGLFAVSINNLNTDIIFNTRLYIKDSDNNFILYKDDSWKGLPIFNPALSYVGSEINFILNSVPQYLDLTKRGNDEANFDVQLFENAPSDSNSCFLYKDDESILEYDNSDQKYKSKPGNTHTIRNYSNMRTWIYPLCYFEDSGGANNGYPHGIWKRATGSTIENLIEQNPNENIENMWEKINNTLSTSNYVISDNAFVKCSEIPTATTNDQETKNILLPIRWTGDYIQFYKQANKQKTYFENKSNIYGYKPEDLKKNSLYEVNLNAINYRLDIINYDNTNPELNTSKQTSFNGHDNQNGFWFNVGDYNRNLTYTDGVETFWRQYDQNEIEDIALAYRDRGSFIINTSDSQQGIDRDKFIFNFSNRNGGDVDDFGIFNTDPINTDGRLILDPSWSLIPFCTCFGPLVTETSYYRQYKYTGFINKILSLCPGYCNLDSPFKLKLPFISFGKYNSEYLYQNPLKFKLLNNNWSRGIDYIMLYSIAKIYNAVSYGGGITQIGAFRPSINENPDIKKLKISVKESIGQNSRRENFSPEKFYEKFKTNTILNNKETQITIPIDAKEFSLELSINVAGGGYDTELSQYNLARSIVVSPQLFINYDSSLNRKYKSDYQLIKQIDLENNYGIRSSNGNDTVMPSNINYHNYLYDSQTGQDNEDIIPNDILTTVDPASNSFQWRKLFKPSEQDNGIVFQKTIDNLPKGMYVFNVNCFCGDNHFNLDDDIFNITIEQNGSTYYKNFGKNRKYILLNNQVDQSSLTITLSYIGNILKYIKNVGLFKVVDEVFSDSNASNFLFENDDVKYNDIVLPGVYCFRETRNGDKVGCMNIEFAGYQELPMRAYQECLGFYELGQHISNGENPYDLAHIVGTKTNMLNDQIEKIKIRIISEENDS